MTDPAACATLPSSETATRLLAGDASAWPVLIRDFIGRAAIIGSGLWLAGDRDFGAWLRHSVGASLGFEMFVLWHRALEMPPMQDPNAGDVCASLPSTETSNHLLAGDTSKFLSLLRDFGSRMAIMGAGLWLAGDHDIRTMLRHAVGGSLSVTMFGLWYRAGVMQTEAIPQHWDPAAGVIESQPRITRLVPQLVPWVDGAPAYSPVHRVLAA